MTLDERYTLLASLLAGEPGMLEDLARVAGIDPPERLAAEPLAQFSKVAAFIDDTDFRPATEDARTWLLNRLGLYLARWFIARHGGWLDVQANPAQRFYLHFVVTDMNAPVVPGARLDPFAIALDAIGAEPRIGLAALVATAEQALTGAAPGQ